MGWMNIQPAECLSDVIFEEKKRRTWSIVQGVVVAMEDVYQWRTFMLDFI
jgi:hypothetical protein